MSFQLTESDLNRCLFLASQDVWLAPLKRGLIRRRIALQQVESRDEIASELRSAEDQAVAIEFSCAEIEQHLDLVSELSSGYPTAMLISLPVGDCGLSELALRVAGCTHVGQSVREVEQVCRLIERFLKRVCRRPADIESQIMSQLPWSETR